MSSPKLRWDANIPTELFKRLFPRRKVGKQLVIIQRTASDNLWIVLDRRDPKLPRLRLYGLENLAKRYANSPKETRNTPCLMEIVGWGATGILGVPMSINPYAPGPTSLSCIKTQIAEINGHMLEMWAEVHEEVRSWVDPVAA
jgi:hypothetical protein